MVPSKEMDEGRNMAEIKLKKREEMDPAYCWDLSSLFGSDEEFEKTEQELAKKIEAFRAKQGTMKESAEALYDVLSGLDDISRVFSSLYVYASQKYHQDMGNQKYQGYAGKMDSMMAVLADASSFVEPEILELDEETVTDQPERAIVAEIIREKALHALDDEIPHGIAVYIDRMKERRGQNIIDIDATIVCERDSHKGIIIGKGGSMLKKIGSNARYEMERLLDTQVNLKLWVKVRKDWRDSELMMKNFGYNKDDI